MIIIQIGFIVIWTECEARAENSSAEKKNQPSLRRLGKTPQADVERIKGWKVSYQLLHVRKQN